MAAYDISRTDHHVPYTFAAHMMGDESLHSESQTVLDTLAHLKQAYNGPVEYCKAIG